MAKTTARKLSNDTVINVTNNTKGILYFKTKDNDEWQWDNFEDSHEMTIANLKEMKRNQKTFFEEQWVKFDDEDSDVIKELNIESYYKSFLSREDIDALFNLNDVELEEKLNSILTAKSTNAKNLIVKVAREKYAAKELTNSFVIDFIESRFGTEIKS